MTPPLLIAGGGLAGGAAACLIARAGRRVLLLEREAAPADKICGEFLSHEAQHTLANLEIDLQRLGARKITKLRLVHHRTEVEAPLPFTGLSLTRRRLDEALLHRAEQNGADIRRGQSFHPDAAATGQTLFLATGKHDLHGLRRPLLHQPEDLVGFKAYFFASPSQRRALDGHVELLMFPGGYAGLQQVEDDRTNLCLLIPRQRLQEAGGTWPALLKHLCAHEPHLAKRLDGATPAPAKPISIYRVPYGHLHAPTPADPAHIFRLGDQIGVTPSFTGDGMSIALHTATRAAELHLAGATASDYHHRIRRDIAAQIRRATLLYRIGRSPPARSLLMALAGLFPQSLTWAAAFTRLPMTALALCLISAAGAAQPATPVGLWRTFDEATGRESGLVRIEDKAGTLSGTIVATVDPADAVKTCDQCEGALHGKPAIGLQFMWGLHADGTIWDGGTVVDPKTGKSYHCSLQLEDGGAKLVVRGYIGIPLFGRSETWLRAAGGGR
jgi:flavin-dependent dehydrogenase/uncharacterized protein (DUF2147 family)